MSGKDTWDVKLRAIRHDSQNISIIKTLLNGFHDIASLGRPLSRYIALTSLNINAKSILLARRKMSLKWVVSSKSLIDRLNNNRITCLLPEIKEESDERGASERIEVKWWRTCVMKRSALMNQQQTFFKYLRWLAVDCFSLNSQYGIGLDYADDSIQVIEFRETLIPIQITFFASSTS